MTVLPLHEVPNTQGVFRKNQILLQTLGLQHLLESEQQPLPLEPVDEPGEFQFSVCCFRKKLDFTQEYHATLYEIVDDSSTLLSDKEFKSGYVLVSKHTNDFTVWMGSYGERAGEKASRNNVAAKKSNAGSKKPRGAQTEAPPASASLLPEGDSRPRVRNLFDEIDSGNEGDDDAIAVASEREEDSEDSVLEFLEELADHSEDGDEAFLEALLEAEDLEGNPESEMIVEADQEGEGANVLAQAFEEMDAAADDLDGSSDSSSSSSSGSSSSSSTSGDGPSASSLSSDDPEVNERRARQGDRQPRRLEVVARAPGTAETVIDLGDLGELRWEVPRSLN